MADENGRISNINSVQVLPRLRAIVKLMGETNLGSNAEEVGLHSIPSGRAMAMFLLSGISTIIIQRVGRWSSEAFLEYTMEQVKSFTWGVWQSMIQNEHFHTINATARAVQDKEKSILILSQQGNGDPVVTQHAIHFSKLSMN